MTDLSSLPSISRLLARPATHALCERHGEAVVKAALRRAVAEARARLRAGAPEEGPEVTDGRIAALVAEELRPRLRRVLNATGVVLHTNLGRAPLHAEALARVVEVAGGYSNLELDLESGGRGQRADAVAPLLRELTGAEDAFAVNNCAGAALLGLSALASGGVAIVSRGELVEIGGGFRVPEILAQAGTRLVEVGTTNRTRLEDYALALDSLGVLAQPAPARDSSERADAPRRAVILRVHRSNFALVGFTHEASSAELAGLARARGVPLLHDLGSGQLRGEVAPGLPHEPTVVESLAAGAALVTTSGDKLLGGPQAGLLFGTRDAIARCRRHPLARALRLDKLLLAALEVTLRLHRDGRAGELPAILSLSLTAAALSQRASALALALAERGIACAVVECEGRVGGGSMALARLPSKGVALLLPEAGALLEALRRGEVPVLARVRDGRVLLDVRCIAAAEIAALAGAVAAALRANAAGAIAATSRDQVTLGREEEE